jgi:hypothetical protein
VSRELTPLELHELLGAHALDALDDDERAQMDAWLERTPEAEHELSQLREVAASIAQSEAEAPPTLWTRIESALAEEPPVLTLPLERARARRAGRGATTRVVAALVAASAVAATVTAVVMSGQISRQDDRLAAMARSVEHDGMRRAAAAAIADPRARTVRLAGSGRGSAVVVAMPDGEGFVMGHGLARLPDGRTYQLWAMTGAAAAPTMVSAGVLGPAVDLAAFRYPAGALGFAVTDEQGAGSVRPSASPVLAGRFA